MEVLKLKLAVKDYLLSDWLTGTTFPGKTKEMLRDVFGSFASVRQKFSAYPNQQEADTAWLLGAPESLALVTDFLDGVLYSDTFDGRYRDAVKSKHECPDFMDYPSVKKRLQEVEEALRREQGPETAAAETTASEKSAAQASGQSTAAPAEPKLGTSMEEKMSKHEAEEWRQHMLKNLRAQIRFVSDKKSAAELEQAIKDCPFAKLQGDPTGLVLLHFDVKKFGEPATRPDLRITPLRDGPYTRLVRAVLTARQLEGCPATLQTGDVAVILDGGKKGSKLKLLTPWKEGTQKEAKKGSKQEDEEEQDAEAEPAEEEDEDDPRPDFCAEILQIAYTEESLNARRKRIRGTCSLKQIEWAHVLSTKRLSLPCRARKHYPGSSTGDLIQGVAVPAISDEWSIPWRDKKALYGKKNLIPVGGKTETTEETEKSDMDRLHNKPEAVCFHSMPAAFYAELMHQFWAKLVIDLTPLDGRFAFEALKARVGYVGLTFTPEHTALLEERLLALMQQEMLDSSSPLFNSAYAEAMGVKAEAFNKPNKDKKDAGKDKDKTEKGKDDAPKPEGGKDEDKKPRKRTKDEAEPKRKPKPKKAAKTEGQVTIDDDAEGAESDPDEDVWDPLA